MFLDLIKTKLSQVNPSTVLTGMGATGVVTTAYLTGRASFKAAKVIAKEEFGQEEELSPKERARLVWPLYVAPVSVGMTTIVAIVTANQQASRKVAALTVASGISERALQEYKAKVVEKLGENKERTIRDEIAQDKVTNDPVREVIIAGAGDVLCYDVMTGRYFMSSVEKIRQAANKINYNIINHDYASLSSFYDEIGLTPTPMSDEVGWNTDHRLEVQFSTVMSTDQRPCIAIDFEEPPFVEYSKLW